MPTPLLRRMAPLLGTWRGPAGLETGRNGIIQMRFAPLFEGNLVQLDATTSDAETGETLSVGAGLIALDRSGRIVEGLYAKRIGLSLMHETPDDPEVVAISGDLPGGLSMGVSFRVEEGEMLFTSQVKSGAVGMGAPRTVARLKRVGGAP